MESTHRIVTAGTLGLAFLLAPGAHASGKAAPGSFEARLASKDIVYSHQAMEGARVSLIVDPREHAAGVSLPVLAGGHAQALQVLVTVNSLAQQLGIQSQVQAVFAGGGSKKDKVEHLATIVSGTNLATMVSEATGISMTAGDLAWAIAPDSEVPTGEKLGQIKGAEPAPQELVRNNEFTNGLEHWDHDGKAFTASAFGPVHAAQSSKDNVFAVIHTGLGDASDKGWLSQAVTVNMSRNATFSLLYNFVTNEFPDWQGTQYNDYFNVSITGPSGEKTLSMAEFLNATSFEPVSGLPGVNWETLTWQQYFDWVLNGVAPPGSPLLDHDTGGQTGWRTFNQSGLALKSGVYKVRFEVGDASDRIFDSAALIDRVSLK